MASAEGSRRRVCVFTKMWRHSTGPFAQDLARALADAGWDVRLIAPLADPTSSEADHAHVRRARPPREAINSSSRLDAVVSSMGRVVVGAFHVLAARFWTKHYITSVPEPVPFTLLLFIILRMTGAHIVFVVHDPIPHTWRLPRVINFLEVFAFRLMYKLATHLVTLSYPTALALREKYTIDESSVSVIPIGVEAPEYTSLPEGGPLLIFGAMRSNKRILESIEGVLLARRRGVVCKVIVAGARSREEMIYFDQIEALGRANPDAVELRLGYVPHTDIPMLMSSASAVILAYEDYDSHSGVGLTAALHARPAIATHSGGLQELFDRGLTGIEIETPVTPSRIADAIQKFYAFPRITWYERALVGRDKILGVQQWPVVAQAYAALI